MKRLYILIVACLFWRQVQAQTPTANTQEVLIITKALLAVPVTEKSIPAKALINGKAVFSTRQYYARKVLQTQGDVHLTAGDKQIFRAGEAILLEPGFSVDSLAEFTAEIAAPEPEKTPSVAITQPATADTSDNTAAEARTATGSRITVAEPAYGFTLFPNPADEIVYVRYQLTEEAPVKLTLLSMNGAAIQTLRPSAQQPAGAYELSFTISAVPAGMYLISLHIGNLTFSQRLVVK